MNKILVLGPSGAGKSYFARLLSNKLNLPLYHLDSIWWNSDKTHITRCDFDEKLSLLLRRDRWIIDGDYSRTYEVRIKACDTIIFLDYPLEVCLEGIASRIGTIRPDLPWVEKEVDPEFKKWVIGWFSDTLPVLKELLNKYKDEKNIIIFKSRKEANEFLDNL